MDVNEVTKIFSLIVGLRLLASTWLAGIRVFAGMQPTIKTLCSYFECVHNCPVRELSGFRFLSLQFFRGEKLCIPQIVLVDMRCTEFVYAVS